MLFQSIHCLTITNDLIKFKSRKFMPAHSHEKVPSKFLLNLPNKSNEEKTIQFTPTFRELKMISSEKKVLKKHFHFFCVSHSKSNSIVHAHQFSLWFISNFIQFNKSLKCNKYIISLMLFYLSVTRFPCYWMSHNSFFSYEGNSLNETKTALSFVSEGKWL